MKVDEEFQSVGKYAGGILLRHTKKPNLYFRIEWGSGDALSEEDIEEGYDDYINVDMCQFDKNGEFSVFDGGVMLVKHEDDKYEGKIENAVEDAYEFIVGSRPEEGTLEPITIIE